MRACICAFAVRVDRGSCMYICSRDAGLEVDVEREGFGGDFRMPGLVGGTVVQYLASRGASSCTLSAA